jgi:glycosyltransferase involved in cell wall biosynthesis
VIGAAGVPTVSVIVPVRDRRQMLRQLLDALASQTVADHEVIVVDDGSVDGSADEARRDAAAGRPVRLFEAAGKGAVAARRRGVAESRSALLAFTDSDCVPEPGWLAAGVEALEQGADLVQGVTQAVRPPRLLERCVQAATDDGLYPTCNVFYRRTAYDAADGFDLDAGERLGFRPGSLLRGLGFGEDVLLGWRVRRSGRAAFAPDAVVAHHVFPVDLGESLRRAWTVGAFPALVREIPELRRTLLVNKMVLGGHSRLPLYAAALALAARRHRVATAALAAWAAGRVGWIVPREASWTRRAKVLPVDLMIDAVSAAALVVGSLRARRIVL